MNAPLHAESIAALEHLARTQAGQRLAFVSGNFNVLHPGHMRLLKFAADLGRLVVGVTQAGTPGAIVPEALRLEAVRAIGIVAHAFILRDAPSDFIAALQPAAVVKGKEHEQAANPEADAVATYGGKLYFSSGEIAFASLDLIRREFQEINLSTIVKPRGFPERHGFAVAGLRDLLARFKNVRVLVLGDLIVDEYVACDALGLSQEDPTIVVTPVLTERFLGGAGIVAGHASGLGARTRFISVTGDDFARDFAAQKLDAAGVAATLLPDSSRPTTLKQRFRASNKTLLRVSHLKQHGIDTALQARVLEAVDAALPATDLLVFSDFNYGVLPQKLVDAIIARAAKAGVPAVADSQSSSQVGDIARFAGMKLVKPTEREARLALRDFDSGLVVLAEKLRAKANAQHVILSLGAEGLLVHAPDRANGRDGAWMTDRLPAFNESPKDPSGAGDSLLITAALALAAGGSIWQATYLGAIAAACQVGRVGNVPLTAPEVEAEILS
jgi:rfaE bifunctional protein kinase chain/domain